VKTSHRLAGATSEVRMSVPASALDLPHWFFDGFSDGEYQRCSRGHFAAGTSTLPDGTRTSVSVESVGGHLAVHHYREDISEPDHLKLVSERSDAWIFHLFRFHPSVTWEMRLVPASDDSCFFRCTVSVEHPSILIKAASVLTLFQYFVERHDHEEAKPFAESLAKRARRADAPAAAAHGGLQ
jgi:hypothetical protein